MRYKGLIFFILLITRCSIGLAQEGILDHRQYCIHTDKAVYLPGDTVHFSLEGPVSSGSYVRYYQLNKIIGQKYVTGRKWDWKAPEADFKGYMAAVFSGTKGKEKLIANIAIDVSSDWSRFPRYGFLSKYPAMPDSASRKVVRDLNRYHINGLQFYDWQYKHHQPLAGSAEIPDTIWKDIANRSIHLQTIKNYITSAHHAGMKAMFYNLVYGALKDAAADGVNDRWYMYDDQQHRLKHRFALPKNFNSDIFFTDPANVQWQAYINAQNERVYQALDFDGYHMDQVGNRDRKLFTYDGQEIALPERFKSFIEAIKVHHPGKAVVMNAVNQYGQDGIAASPVDFIYSEVWAPNNTYDDLAKIIMENDSLGRYRKRTVLAAYMNYDLAEKKGYFNTPSILLTDAVIFAFGGSHLELGEHMLGKEYFPNNNLSLRPDLKAALVKYYDFMVSYENLLRDGYAFQDASLYAKGLRFNNRKPAKGEISLVSKMVGGKQVVNLLNFMGVSTVDWRDAKGQQVAPTLFKLLHLSMQVDKKVRRVWIASPDINNGLPQHLSFTQYKGRIQFTLPTLKYWDMVVLDYNTNKNK